MKTALLILTLLFICPVYGQTTKDEHTSNIVKNLTCWNFDSFTERCLKDLNVDSCMIIIQPVDGLIKNEYLAATFDNQGAYTIAISTLLFYQDAMSALAHELIHVRQMAKGELKELGRDMVQFRALTYKTSKRSHYSDPHEVEARTEGLRLFKQYKFIIK